jgi:hypothetical protein
MSAMKIKTFGPVDERSLKQIERCMDAADARYAVLSADLLPGDGSRSAARLATRRTSRRHVAPTQRHAPTR